MSTQTQNTLTRVNAILAQLTPENTPWSPLQELQALAADLEAQLRFELAASKGVGNAARMISAMLKPNLDYRPSLAYPWIDGERRQCVCDGYQAYRLREHLPLADRPDDAGDPIDLDRIFPDSLAGWKPLPMPSAKQIKEFIAVERAKWTGRAKDFNAVWSFGDNEPSVNAKYLLNAATLFPDAEQILWNTLISPLVIISEHGDGLILPVRDKNKAAKPPATDAERAAIEREKAQQEENNRRNAEEYQAREKARSDADAALEDSKNAQYAELKALSEANRATDEQARAAAMQDYFDACEAEGKARLRQHAATLQFTPSAYLELVDLTAILSKLYARQYNAV